MSIGKYYELILVIILCFIILLLSPDRKYTPFVVEIVTEKPYIMMYILLVYFLSIYSKIVALLFGIILLLVEYDVNIVLSTMDKKII